MLPKNVHSKQKLLKYFIEFLNTKGDMECVSFEDLIKFNIEEKDMLFFFCNILKKGGYLFRVKKGLYTINKRIPYNMTIDELLIFNQYGTNNKLS